MTELGEVAEITTEEEMIDEEEDSQEQDHDPGTETILTRDEDAETSLLLTED